MLIDFIYWSKGEVDISIFKGVSKHISKIVFYQQGDIDSHPVANGRAGADKPKNKPLAFCFCYRLTDQPTDVSVT